ncbi:MAG: cytochrome c-type biogenesis protein CcmH [Gammaproteobacteria bacterium]
MVARYGDFVLYRPPLRATTLLLWAGPALLLLVALAVYFNHLSRQGRGAPAAPLDEAEQARVRELLEAPRAGGEP